MQLSNSVKCNSESRVAHSRGISVVVRVVGTLKAAIRQCLRFWKGNRAVSRRYRSSETGSPPVIFARRREEIAFSGE